MGDTVFHAGVMLFGVFVASVAQVLLKSAAMKTYESRIKEYLNIRVIVGYGMMLFCTLCAIYAYRAIPISMGTVLDATGYIYVTLFGYIIFKEKINSRRIAALILIVAGIAVYALLG